MNRALLVGINAYPENELNGCIDDVTDMADFLVGHCGFSERDVRLITDRRATTGAILDRLKWLVGGAAPGDRLVFHYSGHGAQLPVRDDSGNVVGVDECICPVDFDWTPAHAIRDKQFHQMFAEVPQGVKFNWISDSCFSGDLARGVRPPGWRSKAMPMPADIAWRLRTAEAAGLKRARFEHAIAGLSVVLVSGCGSHETAADAEINGRANGALTYFLLQTLSAPNGLTQSLEEATVRTQAALRRGGYSQHPQLEGSTALMKAPFLG
jgi:hypothetical protein